MLRYFAYSIPFHTPFKTASKTFTHRNGILLVLEQNGITAYGEVAPLPGFSPESIGQVLSVLLENQKYLENGFKTGMIEPFIKIVHSVHQFPSLAFGLDTLAFDYLSKTENKSLQEFIFKENWEQPKVNAVLGMDDKPAVLTKASEAITSGFETVKLKVGMDFDHERSVLAALRSELPKLNIRIDANQAWSVDEAIRNLSSLENLSIEFCEQPIAASDINGLKKVSNSTSIPIAADEAVRSFQDAKNLIEQDACKILILKPSLFGRYQDLIVTKELAATHGIEVVFTTALETVTGRTSTAILASGLGSESFAHGLATGTLLKEPESHSDEIIHGQFSLSKYPGVGRHVDLSCYQEIR